MSVLVSSPGRGNAAKPVVVWSSVLAYSISIGLSKKSFVRWTYIIMISYGRYSVIRDRQARRRDHKMSNPAKRDKILDTIVPASLLCYYGDEF